MRLEDKDEKVTEVVEHLDKEVPVEADVGCKILDREAALEVSMVLLA
jgi:hypothetical protein